MRPSRSFFYLLIFLVCFTGLHYILSSTDLFPSIREFVPREISESFFENNPDTLYSGNQQSALTDSVELADSTLMTDLPADTLPADSARIQADPLTAFSDSLLNRRSQTRILYYGDSQLEGDRITSKLRMSLRQFSGGTGPGMFLPVMPVMYTKTLWLRSSPNWERYNYLSFRNREISHKKFGPFMAICRYLPEGTVAATIQKASVRIKPSLIADSSSSFYDNLRIFYRNSEGPVNITVNVGKTIVCNDTLDVNDNFNEYSCNLVSQGEVTIEFSGFVSPEIYGISIESKSGIIVDNIPQRGSAGLEFTMVDQANLRESFEHLRPDLIILQYGLNIVRNVRTDYSYYTKGLERQISVLKRVAPGVTFIIVGLTDMATGSADSVRSFPNIPAIIEAEQVAATQEDVVFWNSRKAMGGESSIIKWSKRNPPLAQKDLVHLTYEGADSLAALMLDSLFLPSLIQTETTAPEKLAEAKPSQPPAKLNSQLPVQLQIKKPGKLAVLISSIFSYDPQKPMIFTTAAFWLFFLIVIAGYSLIYKKLFLRNFYLFTISLFFYYKSGGLFLFLLIFVTVIDYVNGLIIGTTEKKHIRRLFIVLSVVSNIGILAWFKYTGFIVNSLNELLGTDFRVYDLLADLSNVHLGTSFNISNIILPVGISFFTFQSLSYTIDVYRRKIPPVRNIIDFGFYVSFFPQLVAGPIVRASEFIPQLYVPYHLEKREFSHAVFLICKGLIKKIIISDFIALNLADRVFDAPSMFSGFENLMAVYGYGLQIYCDFSGYTDIAIGLGLLFGFRLPFNFNSPYKAAGISDFWKRWHISLSRWLKDYLYIPLGGNRKGTFRTYLNLMITMILGGLWHGASLRFIIWGFLHGAGLIVDRIIRSIFGEHARNGITRFLIIILTFNFVSFCWIFFRADSIENIRIMLSQITENFSPGSWSVAALTYSSVFMLIAAGYLVHFLPETVKEFYRGLFIKIPVALQLTVVLVIAVLLFRMRATDTMPFIYFRF